MCMCQFFLWYKIFHTKIEKYRVFFLESYENIQINSYSETKLFIYETRIVKVTRDL
jgi:hypothetical protein